MDCKGVSTFWQLRKTLLESFTCSLCVAVFSFLLGAYLGLGLGSSGGSVCSPLKDYQVASPNSCSIWHSQRQRVSIPVSSHPPESFYYLPSGYTHPFECDWCLSRFWFTSAWKLTILSICLCIICHLYILWRHDCSEPLPSFKLGCLLVLSCSCCLRIPDANTSCVCHPRWPPVFASRSFPSSWHVEMC